MSHQPTNRVFTVTLFVMTTVATILLLLFPRDASAIEQNTSPIKKSSPVVIRVLPSTNSTREIVTVSVDFGEVNPVTEHVLEIEFPSYKMTNTNCDELGNVYLCIEEYTENTTIAWTYPMSELAGSEEAILELSFICEEAGVVRATIKTETQNYTSSKTICESEPLSPPPSPPTPLPPTPPLPSNPPPVGILAFILGAIGLLFTWFAKIVAKIRKRGSEQIIRITKEDLH